MDATLRPGNTPPPINRTGERARARAAVASVRVPPKVWIGLLGWLLYSIVFNGIFAFNGVDYPRIGESADTLLLWYVAPLTGGAIFTVVFVTVLGWWQPALTDGPVRKLPAWALIAPIMMAALAIFRMFAGDNSHVTTTMWIYLVIGSVLVGFNEEMIHRGQLVVALRSRFGELGVWFFSSLIFAAFHLPGLVFGLGSTVFIQFFLAMLFGSVFYLARRASGSLLPAILLHGLWDFSVFSTNMPILGLVAPVIGLFGFVVALIVVLRERRKNALET